MLNLDPTLVRRALDWCGYAEFKPIINQEGGRYQAFLREDAAGIALSKDITQQLFPSHSTVHLLALKSDPGVLRQHMHTDWKMVEGDDENVFGDHGHGARNASGEMLVHWAPMENKHLKYDVPVRLQFLGALEW